MLHGCFIKIYTIDLGAGGLLTFYLYILCSLFRPDMNINRFANSAARLALPNFDKQQLLECLQEYVRCEESWIPEERGYSLYLRPTLIGTQPFLGVGPSKDAKLFIIASPVGPYYKSGFAPVSLLADPQYVRAWPGGVGNAKCGGNYAPGIVPQMHAGQKGHQQNLWLYGPDHEITEVSFLFDFLNLGSIILKTN